MGPSQGELVLDVGAGQGSFTYRLDQLGFRVIGFGITSNQFLASTPYVQCDLDRGIPVRSETAQGVVAIEVIEHLENAFHLLREFARVLTPDGWAILTTPNTTSLTSRVSFALRGYPVFFGPHEYETNGHIHPVALIDIQRMAERCGLTVAYVTYNVGKIPIPKLRHRIPLHQRRFRNRWLGENLIVKLYKTGAPKSEVMRG